MLNPTKNVITEGTMLVSVMAVNNEIGVIQPLKEIGQICREKGAFFHSDIAQAFGKIPINVDECNIDLASISGHKIFMESSMMFQSTFPTIGNYPATLLGYTIFPEMF